MKASLLYVTTKTRTEARSISKTVVSENLAACANILGEIEAFHNWENRTCKERETAFILKTSTDRVEDLIDRIKILHSYKVPCIIETKITNGNQQFIEWLKTQVS